MFVFWKIWRALFSWNTHFEIRTVALLATKWKTCLRWKSFVFHSLLVIIFFYYYYCYYYDNKSSGFFKDQINSVAATFSQCILIIPKCWNVQCWISKCWNEVFYLDILLLQTRKILGQGWRDKTILKDSNDFTLSVCLKNFTNSKSFMTVFRPT